MLENAAEWLNSQREANLSVPVTYNSRNRGLLSLSASLGKTLFRAEDEYGITVRVESRDFLISASQLPFEPVRGDSIDYAGYRYEVLAPNGEPVWRWSGASHITRRIHTKEIGKINA